MASPLTQYLASKGLAQHAPAIEQWGCDMDLFKGMSDDDVVGMCTELSFPGGIKLKLRKAAKALQGSPPTAPPTALPPAPAQAQPVAVVAPGQQAPVAVAGPPMCAFCGKKPVSQGHPYCGQTCAGNAKKAGISPPTAPVAVAGPPVCAFCGKKPVSQGHPYCGQTCAGNAKKAGISPPTAPVAAAGPPMCAFCGKKPVSQGHPYCGQTCAGNAKKAGISPPTGAAMPPTAVAVPVAQSAATRDPRQCAFCQSRKKMRGHPYCGRTCAGNAQKVGWINGNPPGAAPAPQVASLPIAQAAPVAGAPAGTSVAAPPTTPAPAPTSKIATYQVTFPFNPSGLGFRLGTDLTIESLVPGSIEQQAGVMARCKIVAVNSTPVADPPSFFAEIVKFAGKPVQLDLTYPPTTPAPLGQPPIGTGAQLSKAATSSPSQPGMCAYCGRQPVSHGHPYCSRTCGTTATRAGWVDGVAPGAAAGPAKAPKGPCPKGNCPFCHSKGIAKQVAPGQPYCGKTCGGKAQKAGWVQGVDPETLKKASTAGTLCRHCRLRPQSKGHPYCSKACAQAFDLANPWQSKKESTSTPGVVKYTIDQSKSVSAVATQDSFHFNQAFAQYGKLLQGSSKQVVKVEYYINPALQSNFDKKQAEFKAAGKSSDPVWVFHGTKPENVSAIMEEGFRVGGKNYPPSTHWKGGTFPVANGAAYGQGVYSATGPGTPMGYSRSTGGSGGKIILAMGLKGQDGRGNDSWSNSSGSDWIIFKDDEQVLPMYVVHHN